jgi:UV-endonuclease UvdE
LYVVKFYAWCLFLFLNSFRRPLLHIALDGYGKGQRDDHSHGCMHAQSTLRLVLIQVVQGVYGSKVTTLERFKVNYRTKLTGEMRQRLVLENDEVCSHASDYVEAARGLHSLDRRCAIAQMTCYLFVKSS